ncbi:MAG: aspartyl protease family protein [Pyrinomonadaceae bacterium]
MLLRSTKTVSVAALVMACVLYCALSEDVRAGMLIGDSVKVRAARLLREGEFESAEKLYRELIAKDAHDNEARLGLSFALLKQRNFLDAYDHAARVLASDPLSSRAHALLGSVVLASGDFRLAIEEFRTALSFKETEALAVAGLAMVDFYDNRLNECISGLRRAISLDGNEPDYVFNLGQAAARSQHYAEAADAYERFLQIAPRTDADRRARIRGLIDFLRYIGKQKPLYQVQSEDRVSVPFEAVGDRPIFKVRVNGAKEPLRFVLDTGSGMSVISEEAAKHLNVRPVARGGSARAVGGGGRFEIVYGFLPFLELGEPDTARIENVPVYIRRFYNDKDKIDGYIGLSALKDFVVAVDYGARSMTLLRGRASKDDAALASQTTNITEIPVRTTASGFVSGEVHLDGVERPLNFVVDTGASVSVLSESLVAREAEVGAYTEGARLRVYGAAGISENIQTLLLPQLTLGSYRQKNVNAAVLDLGPINETSGFEQTGIVGGNFLRNFRVTFDLRRGVVRLEPLSVVPVSDKTLQPAQANGTSEP